MDFQSIVVELAVDNAYFRQFRRSLIQSLTFFMSHNNGVSSEY